MNGIETDVRHFVIENFLYGRDEVPLAADASFTEEGVIDSTGVLELVGFLEKHFGIRVDDQDLVPENLDSIGGIVRYVESKNGAH